MVEWHDFWSTLQSLSNVNVGTDEMSSPLISYTLQQPFYLLPLSIESLGFFRLFLKLRNTRVPSVLQCYFDQKPVQTILAIIQQKDYFYPDSFISFVVLAVGICM